MPQALQLWDVWTPIAAQPVAYEPPSAGFALDWQLLAAFASKGIVFATITHAAGISSTGDAELDRLLPFDEPYRIPAATELALRRACREDRRVVAIGTTVVRALEHSAARFGAVMAGDGVADQRIGAHTRLRVVDAILVRHARARHQPLRPAARVRGRIASCAARIARSTRGGFRTHEFGDSVLIERGSEQLFERSADAASRRRFSRRMQGLVGARAVRILRAFCAPPMWFKNLVVYRLPADWSVAPAELEEKLAQRSLQPCGSFDMQSRGWVHASAGAALRAHDARPASDRARRRAEAAAGVDRPAGRGRSRQGRSKSSRVSRSGGGRCASSRSA